MKRSWRQTDGGNRNQDKSESCPVCQGLGRVFSCPWHPACDCPDGAIGTVCPGVSRPCPACAPMPAAPGSPRAFYAVAALMVAAVAAACLVGLSGVFR